MVTNYCTLFDSNYLDKGIAMAQSLCWHATDYTLFIYAFDKKAYDILKEYNIPNTEIILFEDIITDELVIIRKERSRAEFCWTCTPFIIEYTFEKYLVDICTYVDADLYFYNNPSQLIEEMYNANCSVQIVEHRFPNYLCYRRTEKKSGKYCVEFNTFLNNSEGRNVLTWWKEQCFSCCTSDWKQGSFGDQKYLDYWQEKFKGINVLQNHGGGVAPWNISRYSFNYESQQVIYFKEVEKGKEYKLVFYHFHDMNFTSDSEVILNVYRRPGRVDSDLVEHIYRPYIKELKEIRKTLFEKYELGMPVKKEFNSLLWSKKDSLSISEKIAKIIYLPQAIYQSIFIGKKDIMRIE